MKKIFPFIFLFICFLYSLPAFASTEVINYSYDKTYQLKTVKFNNYSSHYNYDDAGNISSAGNNAMNQNITPTSAITDPANGAVIIGATHTITGKVTDNVGSGISNVELSLDGGATWIGPSYGVTDTSGNGTWATAW